MGSQPSGPSQGDVNRATREGFERAEDALGRANERIQDAAGQAADSGLEQFRNVFNNIRYNFSGQSPVDFRRESQAEYGGALRDATTRGLDYLNQDINLGNVINQLAGLTSGGDSLANQATAFNNPQAQSILQETALADPNFLRATSVLNDGAKGAIPLSEQDINYLGGITDNTLQGKFNYVNPLTNPADIDTTLGDVRGSQFEPGVYQDTYFGAGARQGIDEDTRKLEGVEDYNIGKHKDLGKEKDYNVGGQELANTFVDTGQNIGTQAEGTNIGTTFGFVGSQAEGTNINKPADYIGAHEDKYDTVGQYEKKKTDIGIEGQFEGAANQAINAQGARDYSEQIGQIGQQPALNLDQRVTVGTQQEGQGKGFAASTVDEYNIGGREVTGTDAYDRDYGVGEQGVLGQGFNLGKGYGIGAQVEGQGAGYLANYGTGEQREGQGTGYTQSFGVGEQSGIGEAGFNADYGIGEQEQEQAERAFDIDYGVGTSQRGRQGFSEAERIARDTGRFGRLAGGFREDFGIGEHRDPGIFKRSERQLGRIAGTKTLR